MSNLAVSKRVSVNNVKADLFLKPNKARLFEGSFFWGEVNLTPLLYFKKNLSNNNITLYYCERIYFKYVESEKKKKKNAHIICYKLTLLVSL